ncbi:unnamed protein product [Urochloa decumbens]|uniref:H(+)/Pi cotransporter n=1 Tax=Urochloa decumbens TaxID=240449 RepID=A0ABC8XSP5_9POAL
MDDTATAPLLTSHNAKPAKPPSIDDMIETHIGDTGAAQLLRAVFVALAWAFDAQQVFISVFTDAAPGWHCVGLAGDSPCTAAAAAAATSVVSEWALQCAGPALVSLPASSFFAGCLAGGFLLTTLADSHLGRKRTLLACLVSMSVAGALTAAAPNVWAYAALRFASGFARSVVGTCTLVLSTELVGRRWRDVVSVAAFLCYTAGFLSLPALAYALRGASWRSLYLWTSVSCLCYAALLHFLAQESPRWLLVRGRTEEAVATLRQIASLNGGGSAAAAATAASFSTLELDYACAAAASGGGVFATLRMMWERPWAIRRLAAIMAAGFGVGMVYFGMPLGVGSLGGPTNLYLSTTYNALAEVPSAALSWLLIARAGRRASVAALAAAAGACSLAAAVSRGARMAAELASFFATCTAYDLLLIYAVELFPTSVRNSAVGMVRQAMVLGGVAAPVLVALGRERGSFWSFGVFGIAIGSAGLFAACLPETRGKPMSDTMEEEEEERNQAAMASCTSTRAVAKINDRDLA